MSSCSNIPGCPAPEPVTLFDRLCPFIGRTVTVHTADEGRLSTITGRLTAVTPQFFIVGTSRILFLLSFYIMIPLNTRQVKPYEATVTANGIGTFTGKLVSVGIDFVELLTEHSDTDTLLFPLNRRTEVRCECEHEE
jgi:hypothetical protein